MPNSDNIKTSILPNQLDPDFGSKGIFDFNEALIEKNSISVAVKSDHNIFLCSGLAIDRPYSPIWVIKLSADGGLDTEFGDQGVLWADVGQIDGSLASMEPVGIFRDKNGRYLVVGWTFLKYSTEICAVRFNDAGIIDETFGLKGVKRLPIHTEADGKQKVKGRTVTDTAGFAASTLAVDEPITLAFNRGVVRLTGELELDRAFNKTGILIIDETPFQLYLAIQPSDKKLLVAGNSRIFRYMSNGAADESFAEKGFYTAPSDITIDALTGAVDGYINFLGVTRPTPSNPEYFLGQLLSNGQFDLNFNDGELAALPQAGVTPNFGSSLIGLDEQNRLSISVINAAFRTVVLRLLRNGNFDESFNNGQVFITALRTNKAIHTTPVDRVVVFGQSDTVDGQSEAYGIR